MANSEIPDMRERLSEEERGQFEVTLVELALRDDLPIYSLDGDTVRKVELLLKSVEDGKGEDER